MTLSEAIRIGSKSGPQCFEELGDGKGGSCAIGAALKAAGEPLMDKWRWLTYGAQAEAKCPACEEKAWAYNVIMHLNDDHRWTRERIADWIETIEPKANISTNINTIAVSGEDQFLATD